MGKRLGKITNAEFGMVHDRPFLFGLMLDFGGDGWGVGCLDHTVNMSKECEWKNKRDRQRYIEKIMNFTFKLLNEAKVNNVKELQGIAVEVEFSGDALAGSNFKSFRILKEVI